MNKNNNNAISKSGNFFNIASGVKFNYKMGRRDFFQGNEYSCELELEKKPELNKKSKNENEFRPGTKQEVNKNKLKSLNKRLSLDEEDKIKEEKEDDEIKEENNNKNNYGNETPPSHIRKNIYTEKNNKLNKVILDSEEEDNNKIEEEDKLNNSLEDKNKKKEEEKNDKFVKDNRYKESNEINSVGGDNKKLKYKLNKSKKIKKWDEEEYQKLKSESKNYIPFKEFDDINKYLLTLSQMNNMKTIPELYNKYIEFLSLKKKQDQIQMDVLMKNILIEFKNIYKYKTYYNSSEKKLPYLVNEQSIEKLEYFSNEKTAYFDFFICFMKMYVEENENLVEITSIPEQKKLIVPLHTLAYIFSSQAFFRDIAKVIHIYYDKYLTYKIIPIFIKENEEYRYRINSRQTIWKQFEEAYLYYRDKKKLYLTDENGEKVMNKAKIEKLSEEIKEGVKSASNDINQKIIEKHKKINEFDFHDNNITLTNKNISAPSSLYNQINEDILFKLKINAYKYNIKRQKFKKNFLLNEAAFQKNDFNNIIKNKLFKQSVFYMNPCDVVQDFLDNYD